MKLRETAIAIIIYDGKILLFKRDDIPTLAETDMWQLPGGHIEEGETPAIALKRELVEEVSYAPSNLAFVGKLRNNFREVHIFWCYVDEYEAKKFRLGGLEGQEIRFMNIDEALKEKLTKNIEFYLSAFKDLISEHLKQKTIPNIKEFL